eukprot:7263755-Prymnesium_polylepis.1
MVAMCDAMPLLFASNTPTEEQLNAVLVKLEALKPTLVSSTGRMQENKQKGILQTKPRNKAEAKKKDAKGKRGSTGGTGQTPPARHLRARTAKHKSKSPTKSNDLQADSQMEEEEEESPDPTKDLATLMSEARNSKQVSIVSPEAELTPLAMYQAQSTELSTLRNALEDSRTAKGIAEAHLSRTQSELATLKEKVIVLEKAQENFIKLESDIASLRSQLETERMLKAAADKAIEVKDEQITDMKRREIGMNAAFLALAKVDSAAMKSFMPSGS